MEVTYSIVTGIIFLFLALIWNRDDVLNAIVKTLFIIMFLWSILDTVDRFGFISAYRPRDPTPSNTEVVK